jgi:hypothetical protein
VKPAPDPALTFLSALFGGHVGLIELRALPQVRRTTFRLEEPDEARRFIAENSQQNVYVGVALRRPGGGGTEACIALPALFVDIDFKTTPRDQARAAVRRFPLTPSVAVRSGGGVHLYWLLREPMALPEEAPRAKELLRGIARSLSGDLSAAEPARILRLPGTKNFKYAPPPAVELARLDSGRRYNPSEFDFLPAEPEAAGDGTPLFALPEQIRSGERNVTLYALARSLKGRGLGEREILAALTAVNKERCHPPLEEQEVCALAHHAAVQMDRPRASRRVEVL